MNHTTVQNQSTIPWQRTLAITGILGVIAAFVLEITALRHHATTTVQKSATLTTTTTGPSAPPASLVTTVLAAGIVLILVAAFFSRINKIAITGVGEIDLNTAAAIAGKAAARARGDAKETERIYKAATSQAAGLVTRRVAELATQRVPAMNHLMSFAHTGSDLQPMLDDGTLQQIVDNA